MDFREYIQDVRAYPKQSGRQTGSHGIGLAKGKNKKIIFEMYKTFPGVKLYLCRIYHCPTLVYGGKKYRWQQSWDQNPNTWKMSLESSQTNNILANIQALVLLMNTDNTKKWLDRLLDTKDQAFLLHSKKISFENAEHYGKIAAAINNAIVSYRPEAKKNPFLMAW